MSILSLLFDLADELTPTFGTNDNFGFGLYPEEICRTQRTPRLYLTYPHRHRYSPYSLTKRHSLKEKHGRDLSDGKGDFQVSMDVQQFHPNELSVKTVDNCIVVEGKHEEREDEHGSISRQFIRRYILPEEYDIKQVVSTLSSDGILTIKAPQVQKFKSLKSKERIIHIQQQTGKENSSIEDKFNGI